MLTLTLLATLSAAEAGPTKGFRLGTSAGASSHCPLAQIKLGYFHEHFGWSVGFGLVNLSATGQYYLSSSDSNTRQFVSASMTPLAFPGAILGFDGSVALAVSRSIGASYGVDFHLLNNRSLILSPRIGVDLNEAVDVDATNQRVVFAPSTAVDLYWSF